jgi:hypothetical protein
MFHSVPVANPSNCASVPLVPDNFFRDISARSDERLANLPIQDQEVILSWFDAKIPYRQIIELAALPRPEGGLEINLSLGSLSRFHQKTTLAEKVQNSAALLRSIAPNASHPKAALRLLAQTYAADTLASPDLDHAAFQQITRYLLRQEDQRIRQRALDLHQKRLAFHMQHAHYDIFKRTIEKLPEINQLVHDKSLTPAQRVREHFIKIFGRESVDMVEAANRKYHAEHPDQRPTEPDIDPRDITPPLTDEEYQAKSAQAVRQMFGMRDQETPTKAP